VRVEVVEGFVEVEVAGVAGAGEEGFDIFADLAVVRDEIERERDGVGDEGFADEDLGGVNGIDLPVADGAGFELEAVEARALFHHHASGVDVPERFAVGNVNDVSAEFERPGGVEAGASAGVEAGGFDDFGGDQPPRRAAGRGGVES
jgi:hypothetical protein